VIKIDKILGTEGNELKHRRNSLGLIKKHKDRYVLLPITQYPKEVHLGVNDIRRIAMKLDKMNKE